MASTEGAGGAGARAGLALALGRVPGELRARREPPAGARHDRAAGHGVSAPLQQRSLLNTLQITKTPLNTLYSTKTL